MEYYCYKLTPWSADPLTKQTDIRMVKFCTFYGTWRFIFMVSTVCQIPSQKSILFTIKFWRFREIAKSNYELHHVCPSVFMEQLGSHWTDFHEIWYLNIFRKTVENFQVPLKSDKNNRYFTWTPIYIFDHIPLSSYNEKCLRQKLYRKSKHILCSVTFSKIMPFMR